MLASIALYSSTEQNENNAIVGNLLSDNLVYLQCTCQQEQSRSGAALGFQNDGAKIFSSPQNRENSSKTCY